MDLGDSLVILGLIVAILVSVSIIVLALLKSLDLFSVDSPFVSTHSGVVDQIVQSLQLGGDSVLYDLGCGDGRIIARASELHPEMEAVGVEVGFIPYFTAKFLTRANKKIKIRRENIFEADISQATHIFLYLYPRVVNRLIDKIRTQCAPGTVIVSCDFEISSCTPIKVVALDNPGSDRCQKLFIYQL
jgi:16S rRNA A1518/A1519 N6-dimethyltransferase RsmA/KsgA/DIM1 with predicted DNA glycosylase/AP lyase activity